MSPLAAKPLRYLIELDSDPGVSGSVTVIGYDAESLPENGDGAGYINPRPNAGGRKPGILYVDPPDDIERDYGEPAIVFETLSFWENFDPQVAKWKRLGAAAVEIDNLDTYDVASALKMFDQVAKAGMGVLVKNAAIVDGNQKALLEHPAAAMVIVERDCGTPATYDALRRAAGKPGMPIRFVAYGEGRPWAQQVAQQIKAAGYADMAVTYSSDGEYGSVEHILLPTNFISAPAMSTPMPAKVVTGAEIIAKAKAFIGKFTDGPDVPMMARAIAATYPDMDNYAALAKNSTAWCGIFFAYVCTLLGIRPPYVKDSSDTNDFMWADAPLEAGWGTVVSRAQAQPGDVVVLSSPHHITFFDGNNGSSSFWAVGGNQSNAVTRASFAWSGVRAVVRPPVASAAAVPDVISPATAPMLQNGDVGEYVSELQRLVGVAVDGEFGPDTEAAVRTYQATRGLEVDGVVGPETWAALLSGVPASASATKSGKASWYGQYTGKFKWKDSADAPDSNALGVPDDAQGVSFPQANGTIGKWFAITGPEGITTIEQQTEHGPAAWTGKAIDIHAACAERHGYSPHNISNSPNPFPTPSTWTWRSIPAPSAVAGLTPKQQAVKWRDLRSTTPQPTPEPEPEPSEPMSDIDAAFAELDAAVAKVRAIAEQQQQVVLPPAVVGSMDLTGLLDKVPDQIVTMLWPRIQALSADEIIDLKRRAAAGSIGMLDLLGILKLSFSDMLTLGAMFGGMFASGGFTAPSSNLPATYQPASGGGLWNIIAKMLPAGR